MFYAPDDAFIDIFRSCNELVIYLFYLLRDILSSSDFLIYTKYNSYR